ncbi:hypothetical protein BGAPBR_I0033 (plasmid) [Borreliella garinii PBr]|uniref:Uncharacterized protein n=1 Tax=Borreliella garinii PBr TaxID=498743 RepID=B8F112_BORGR|nr:hypothetical protein BGAPBR_I0033 [Borreliella garinii PBr]
MRRLIKLLSKLICRLGVNLDLSQFQKRGMFFNLQAYFSF